jgi:PPOX class probable F420-dependent enzyme
LGLASVKIFAITDDGPYKGRRIRQNPAVTVAECTAAGHLRSSWESAHAQVLSVSELPRVQQLMARKYRIDRAIVLPVCRVMQAIAHGRRSHAESVVLVITPGS